jgi:hypothetical protein
MNYRKLFHKLVSVMVFLMGNALMVGIGFIYQVPGAEIKWKILPAAVLVLLFSFRGGWNIAVAVANHFDKNMQKTYTAKVH